MSTDALSTLVDNIPDWLKRLDELDDQIDKRQIDLARLADTSSQASTRSVRNRGSTESIRPRDDDDAPREATSPGPDAGADGTTPNTAARENGRDRSASITQLQTREVVATAQRRARAVVHRKEKTESMLSAQDVARKYHSKTMVIVYYDSWVQSFFEELVKFVSASRNVMRKAKMAAKVAEIKRMAELEFPDDDDDDDEDGGAETGPGLVPSNDLIAAAPALVARNDDDADSESESPEELRKRFLATRHMSAATRLAMARNPPGKFARPGMNAGRGLVPARGADKSPGDIYDRLDKGLEVVQSACEQAAHQFLREGDCTEQVKKIKTRLSATSECATKELERRKMGTDSAEDDAVDVKPRTYRPAVMRRDDGAYLAVKACCQE